jgi:septal ring factor EnvC (AmiA/AmiB activator)
MHLFAQLEIFNPQLLEQFAKLDTIQVVQFLMLILVGGMMFVNIRQQGVAKDTAKHNNDTTSKLLGNMQSQSTQANERENKLAVAIEHQAQESSKIAQALLLINTKAEKNGAALDDTQALLNAQHAATMARIDSMTTQLMTEIRSVKDDVNRLPLKQDEVLRRLDRVLGYVESMRPKLRTGEISTVTTTETLKPADARTEAADGFKMQTYDKL